MAELADAQDLKSIPRSNTILLKDPLELRVSEQLANAAKGEFDTHKTPVNAACGCQ